MTSSYDGNSVVFLRERIKNMNLQINMHRNLIFKLQEERDKIKQELRKKCQHVWIKRDGISYDDLCSKVCIKCNLFNC